MENIIKQRGITCLGVSNFGNVKLSSGHDACYKIKCCSIICRLNKINSVKIDFVYYSLIVSCFQLSQTTNALAKNHSCSYYVSS